MFRIRWTADVLIVCGCWCVNVPAYSTETHRKRCMLLYVTPPGLAKCSHVCVYLCGCVWESEREVYLCLLKGVRVNTASHWAALCSWFVWASACQAVCVRVCVCTQWRACLWPREGEKLPSASVSVTAQGNWGSWKFTAFCHECCKVEFGRSSSQSQGEFREQGKNTGNR